MTVINGTPGNDDFFLSASQDDEVFAGAGDDRFVIDGFPGVVGKLRVDAGDGDDLILLKDASLGPTIVHGGAGKDTFQLFYGGTAYGDAGADIFKLTYESNIQPFKIADFSADDVLDVLPHFKDTKLPIGSDPFAAGYARFMQLGADAMLQFQNGNGDWQTYGYILDRDAIQFTAAQLGGMKTVVVPFPPSVSLAVPVASVMEGSTVTVDVALSAPSTETVLVWISTARLSDGNSASSPVFATLQPGQTTGKVVVTIQEEGYLDTRGLISISASANGYASNPLNPASVTLTLVDNDQKGFTVAYGNPTYAYKNLTLLDAVRPADDSAVAAIPVRAPLPPGRDYARLIEPFVLSTTSVALTAYQFFTGKSPGQAGLKYLVNSPDNASDLNDAGGIYAAMNTENRYINFAANLGLVGEGKAVFAAGYKDLAFRQAVEKAYDAIIGKAYAQAAGIDVAAAIDGVVAARNYFDTVATERMGGFDHDLAMKAGMIGYLIAEGQKAHVGVYARAVENFYLDFMDGSAQHNVDLVAVYGPGTFLDAM